MPPRSYTFASSGNLLLQLDFADGAYGPTSVSSAWNYSQKSPFISSLATGGGSLTGFNTTGGAIVVIKAANLDGATAITVAVGGRLCPLFLVDATGNPTQNVTLSSNLIALQPTTIDAAGNKVYTFGIGVPPGQGQQQAVVVTTYTGKGAAASGAGFSISYAPPSLTKVVVTAADGTSTVFPVAVTGGAVQVPSSGATITFYGSNLGDAPTMWAAAATAIPLTPCPGVTDQSCFTGPAPPGEGDGTTVRRVETSRVPALLLF